MTTSDYKPNILIDFDGVIHAYTTPWTDSATVSDGPVPGALRALVVYAQTYQVNIFSTRSGDPEGVEAMQKALCRWYTEYEDFSEETARAFVYETLHFPMTKVPAVLTIDDNAYRFNGRWPSSWVIGNMPSWYKANHKAKLAEALQRNDLQNRFTYYAPQGDQNYRYQELRDQAYALAQLFTCWVPDSRERALALTHLEEAVMWANAGIARNE